MSHFAAIGVTETDEHTLEGVLRAMMERAEPPPGLGGYTEHHGWCLDPSGAAFGIHGHRGRVDCITPFFEAPRGGTRWRVRTRGAATDVECVHCSGADCDILERESGELVTRATVQWLFFQPFDRWLQEERVYDLQVVGFASALALCADDLELERAQARLWGDADPAAPAGPGKPLRLAPQAFVPSGMFEKSGRMGERAQAMLTGDVEDLTVRTNAFTGARFLHTRIHTLQGALDVVSPIEALDEAPKAPKRAFAQVWLVGRPEGITPPPPPSFWQRLVGR